MEIKKILVIRLSSMGDIVLASPLVRALRRKYPLAIIDFAIKKEFKSLIELNPHINNVISVDTKDMQTVKEIVHLNAYDWIIDIQQSSRATQLISKSKNSIVTGYSKQKWNRFFLINLKLNKYSDCTPVYQRYFEAVDKMGVSNDGEGTEIFISEKEIKKIDHLLVSVDPKDSIVTICPGAKYSNKRWTEEGFIAVAKQIQKLHNSTIVLLGGPDEAELCASMAQSIGGKVMNLAGKLNLLESAALLKRSTLVIANDSGLMHLAQSQKSSVVAIYGPTVKEFGFFPLPFKSTVVETKHKIECRPCTKMGKDHCPALTHHHNCMKTISPEEVYSAVKPYLQ